MQFTKDKNFYIKSMFILIKNVIKLHKQNFLENKTSKMQFTKDKNFLIKSMFILNFLNFQDIEKKNIVS